MSDFERGFAAALDMVADWIDKDMPPTSDFLRSEAIRLRAMVPVSTESDTQAPHVTHYSQM